METLEQNVADNSEGTNITQDELTTLRPYSPKGRAPGFEHLKPINIEEFIIKNECITILLEHPWVKQLKLVSNPYMYRTYGRANYKTNTIELSDRIMNQPSYILREVFIRATSHFIAKKLFDETGEGEAYRLIVQRFMRKPKGQSNSTGNVPELISKDTN